MIHKSKNESDTYNEKTLFSIRERMISEPMLSLNESQNKRGFKSASDEEHLPGVDLWPRAGRLAHEEAICGQHRSQQMALSSRFGIVSLVEANNMIRMVVKII